VSSAPTTLDSSAASPALEVVVVAPVVSFRNPLYATQQLCLPCPPPATVGGMLAAAAGGWSRVPTYTRFAMIFYAGGTGVDLETYHPLDASGKKADPTPRDRAFLADVRLTVWLFHDLPQWQARLRRPVWPLRLGRSQDLVGVRTRPVMLHHGTGQQGTAVLPAQASPRGEQLRLPTAVSLDRARTRWHDYRYDPHGRAGNLPDAGLVNDTGQAVVPLPETHPVHAG
jgi:CRISPR-associated protein Cas5t